jgi:hypothetical protein
MRNRLAVLAFSVLAIVLGLHTLATGQGSRVFGYRFHGVTLPLDLAHVHYTGPFATVEGLLFIGAGIYGLVQAWTGGDADGDG